jgi:DNA-binding transcriptional LysR family regulator
MTGILPLTALRAFEAAARHLNVTRAAAELHVSQSAVSHQLRALEQQLGTALFRRTGSGLVLTDAGRRLAASAGDAFRSLERGLAEIRESHAPGRVSVALRPYFALKWLAPRLARFWQAAPGVELRLIHTTASPDLASGEIDLAVEWRAEPRPDALSESLVRCDLAPVASPSLLRSLRKPADLAKHIVLHEEDRTNWQFWCRLAGIDENSGAQHLIVDDTNVRLQTAIDGQGVALGCPELVADDVDARRLALPFALRLERYRYYLVTPADRPLRRAASAFRDWLRAEAALDGPAR